MKRLLILAFVLIAAPAAAQFQPSGVGVGVQAPIFGLPAINGSAITPATVGVNASTCAAPGIYLTSAPTTGIAFTATPSVILCVNGTAILTSTSSAVTSSVPILGSNGTAALPAYSWSGDPNSGRYWIAQGTYGESSDGVPTFVVDSGATTWRLASDYALSWSSGNPAAASADVILSRGAANQLRLADGDQFTVGDGTAGAPPYAFGNDLNSGLYLSGNDDVRMSIGGTGRWKFTGGDLLAAVTGSGFGPSVPAMINTAPTVTSAGTSPSIVTNGTAAMRVGVGTGGVATTIVLAMPAATTGWNCFAENITATAANRANQRVVLQSSTTTSVTLQNQTISTGAALAFTASDTVAVNCVAY